MTSTAGEALRLSQPFMSGPCTEAETEVQTAAVKGRGMRGLIGFLLAALVLRLALAAFGVG